MGLIRTRTKISNRLDTVDFRYPAVLHPGYPFTKILIRHVHERRRHVVKTDVPLASLPAKCETDDKDGLMALTPEMFLKEIREDSVPDLDYLEKVSLTQRLRHLQL